MSNAPLIVVLRHAAPSELPALITTLSTSGIQLFSIPAQDPAAVQMIPDLHKCYPHLLFGVSTVTSTMEMSLAKTVQAAFATCPHTDGALIRNGFDNGLLVFPGVMTPSEAFTAIQSGATTLKLFPSAVSRRNRVIGNLLRLLSKGGGRHRHTDLPVFCSF